MRKSAFVKKLGETPIIKIIDFLLDNYTFDYSKTEVARKIKISRMTIEPIWRIMIRQKIIKVGNAKIKY